MQPNFDFTALTQIAKGASQDYGSDPNSVWHGYGGAVTPIAPPKQNFLGNLGSSVVNAAKGIAGGLYHGVIDAPISARNTLSATMASGQVAQSASEQGMNIDKARNQYVADLKAKKITPQRFNALIKDLQVQTAQVGQQTKDVSKDIGDYGSRAATGANIGLTIGTFLAPELKAANIARMAGGASETAAVVSKILEGGGPLAKALEAAGGTIGAGKGNIATKAVLNAVQSKALADTPGQFVDDIRTKNYGKLAGDTLLNVGAPLAIHAAGKYLPKLAGQASEAIFGKAGSAVNEFKFKGNQTISEAIDALRTSGQNKLADKYTKVARQLNQHMTDEKRTARDIVDTYNRGNKIGEQTPLQFLDQTKAHITATQMAKKAERLGQLGFDTKGAPVIAAKWSNTERQAAFAELEKGRSVEDLVKMDIIPNNPNLVEEIRHQIRNGDNSAINKIYSAPDSMKTKSAELNKLMAETGSLGDAVIKQGHGDYVFARGPQNAKPYVGVKKTAELINSKEASPLGKLITKAGLSPLATDQKTMMASVRDNFKNALESRGVQGDSNLILDALNSVKQHAGQNDARVLSAGEVRGALQSEAVDADPKAVLDSIREAYARIPASVAGAGPALTNKLQAAVPALGKLQQVEQAGRYEIPVLNAPFRVKQAFKGALVGAAEGGFKALPNESDMKALYKEGLFNTIKGGQEVAAFNATGASKVVTADQRFVIGSLAASIAKANNTTVEKILAEQGPLAEKLRQSIDLTHSYGKGGYLNSPLAKTLNLLIFPSRFETKVAIEGAKAISKLSPVTQAAVVSQLAHIKQWADTPDGKAWQSKNSELIGVAKYLTPIGSIEGVQKFLGGSGKLADLGEIGGLPFGVFLNMIQHQGVNLGPLGASPYNDPKTGKPVPSAIPTSMKARIQQAITDLVNTSYSYPGKTVGLGKKNDLTQTYLPFLKPDKKDIEYRYNDGSKAPALNSKPVTQIGDGPTSKNISTLKPIGKVSIAPKTYTARAPRLKSVPKLKQIQR